MMTMTVPAESRVTDFTTLLLRRLEDLSAPAILEILLTKLYRDRIALLSSFGTEAAVLLHMASEINPHVPVLFLDTRKHFAETLAYKAELEVRFGLSSIIALAPDATDLAAHDPAGTLHTRDTDACCHIRKVAPLEKALKGYDALVTGRKRFQAKSRAALALFETDGDRLKINPLARWTTDDLAAYARDHDLPSHPLAQLGYASIGCAPCTSVVAPGEDVRAGRWRGTEKTECGIHFVGGRATASA